MNSLEFIKNARAGNIDIIQNTLETLDEIKKIDDEYHYFLKIDKSYSLDEARKASKKKKGRLLGLPISVKDCICVKGMETRAGSNILRGYKPVFDATVIQKIRDEGAIIIGKTSQDVFGFGSFNANVAHGDKIPVNPFDKERVTGGSSGGAAGITKKITRTHIAIAESTGGSIACPASYCGVYGFTPTYGRVSRHGLIDYANSLDKIGVIAKEIDDIALMMEIIAGYDEKDPTSSRIDIPEFTLYSKPRLRVAIAKEFLGKGVDAAVKKNLWKKIGEFKLGVVSLPLAFKYSVQTYYLISMSEASTNLARYCGMRYGAQENIGGDFNEYFSKIRSKYFSKEEKRRIILGTFARMAGFRDAFYIKALKVRKKIINEYKRCFKKYDIIITPSMPNIAPRLSEIQKMSPLENYMMDIMTTGPNLCGFPHLSIPSGFSGHMPTGMLAVADHFEEKKLIDFGRMVK